MHRHRQPCLLRCTKKLIFPFSLARNRGVKIDRCSPLPQAKVSAASSLRRFRSCLDERGPARRKTVGFPLGHPGPQRSKRPISARPTRICTLASRNWSQRPRHTTPTTSNTTTTTTAAFICRFFCPVQWHGICSALRCSIFRVVVL